MKNLFNVMSQLVDMHVEFYKSDFDIDKKHMLKNKQFKKYYWFLREGGTTLYSIDTLKNNKDAVQRAEYWLENSNQFYEINVEKVGRKYIYGDIISIKKEKMKNILGSLN